ncbi:hypothetical protein C922_04777 [Plasmodium inui San Antonio 1]|uniref:Uncharacterized protein n=1 Tax=Plasmodium inui San Antonio 1 TaxID=1237626 RepID=W6ZZV3_9APIC|nr:hypothetical protein C922_04777 [Plasmodium inui San Antonio 1]EUD64830.1 hypothetical protein C922_04777 [Plasmodium inui San Antonio 1]
MEKGVQDFLNAKGNVPQNGTPNRVLSRSPNGTPNMGLSIPPNAAPAITQEQFNMIMCSFKRKDKNDQVETSPQIEAQHSVQKYYPLDDKHATDNQIGMNYIANKTVKCIDAPEKTHFPLYVQTDPKGTQLHAPQNNLMHHLQELLQRTPLQPDIKTGQLSKKSDHYNLSVADDVGVNSRSDQGSHLMMHGKNKAEFISLQEDVQRMKNPQMGEVQSCFIQGSTNYSAAQFQDFHNTTKLSHCNNQKDRAAEEVRCVGVNGDFFPSLRSFIVDGASKIDHVMSDKQGGSGIEKGARSGVAGGVERGFCTDSRGEGGMTNGVGDSPPSRLFIHRSDIVNDYVTANHYDTAHREENLLNELKQEVLYYGTLRTAELTSNTHLAPSQGHYKNRDLLLDIQNVCNLNNDQTGIYRCNSPVSNQPRNEDGHTNQNYKDVFPLQGGNIFVRYANYSQGRGENVAICPDGAEGASEMERTHQGNLANQVTHTNQVTHQSQENLENQVTHTNQLPTCTNKLLTRKESHHPCEEVLRSKKTTSCAIHQSCEKMPHLNNPGKEINLQNGIRLVDDHISKMKLSKMLLSSMGSSSPGINVSTEKNSPAGTIQDKRDQGYVNPNWSEQPFMHDKSQVNKSNHLNRVEMSKVGTDLHRDDSPLTDKGTKLPHDIVVNSGCAKYRDLHSRIDQSKGEKCIGRLNVNTLRVGNSANHAANGGGTYGNKFELYTSAKVTTKGNSLGHGSCTITADTKFKPYYKGDHLISNIDLTKNKQNSSIVSTLDDKSKWLVSLYRRMKNFNVGNSLTVNEHVMNTSGLCNLNDKTKLMSGGRIQGGGIPCSHSEDAGVMLLDEFNRIGIFSPEGYFLDSTMKWRGRSHLARDGNNYVPTAIPHHSASNPDNFLSSANKCKEGIEPLSLMIHQHRQHGILHSVQLNRGEEHHTRCPSKGPAPYHHHSKGNYGLNILTNNSTSYQIGRMREKAHSFDATMCNMDDSKEANLLNTKPIKKTMQPLTECQFDHHSRACNGTIWGDLLGLGRGTADVAADVGVDEAVNCPVENIEGVGAEARDERNDNHYDDCYVEGYTGGYPERYSDTRSTTTRHIPPGSKLGIIIQNIRYYSNNVFNDVFMNNDAFKKKKLTELNLYLAKLRVKNSQEFFFNLNKFYEMLLLLLNSNYVHKFNSSILYSICVVAKNLLVLLHLGVYILHLIKTCLYCVVKLILIKPISITDKAWFFLLNLYKTLFEKLYQYFKNNLLFGECEGKHRDLHSYDENSLAILLPFINAFNETILEYAKIRIISRNRKKEELIAFPLYESLKPFFFVNTNYPDEADWLTERTAMERAAADRTAATMTTPDGVEVEDVPLEEAREGPGYTTRSRQVVDGKAQAGNAARRVCTENKEDTGNTTNMDEANQVTSQTTDQANEQTASLKKTSTPGAPFSKKKNTEDIPVEKNTYGCVKSATQLGPINQTREADPQKGDYHCSEQQSGKVDSPVKFYSKKKAEDEELAASIRNNILCCVHSLIKMFSHIYINNWDKILYYYNENRKKLIPIFLTLTMNDQNQKIRTNSILCLKYLFDCKQLKYWFLLKEGSYSGAPLGSHVSGHVSGHVRNHLTGQVTFPPSYPTGGTSSHETTPLVECPHHQRNNLTLTEEIPNGSPTKKMIEVNRQNQNVPVKGDNYLLRRNTPSGKNSYSAGYTNLSFPDKQMKQNAHMGKAPHSVLLFNDMKHIVKREAEIGTNASSLLGIFQGDNQMQTYGEVRVDNNPLGSSSNSGFPYPRREYRYESYTNEESNEKGNYSNAKKASTEQNIVKLLTKLTKLIIKTYMVEKENNFYTPTDRLNICRFFLRVSQSILIPKYKNLLRKILKFFFFYLLKYLIYFNHGDAFHFCIKRLLLRDGTSKRSWQPERNIPFGYSLLPYIEEFAERERAATHFRSVNALCSQTSTNVHLSRHRREMLRMKQFSDNDCYSHDYLDEDERVFTSLSNYLNSFRDTGEHEEIDAQGGEQPHDQKGDGERGDGQRKDPSGGVLPEGVEGDVPRCTGKGGLPIHHHRTTHLSLADQEESATEGDLDKKPKGKSKGYMKKGKEEKKHTEGNNEDKEAATPNDSSKEVTWNDKSAESVFEQAEELPPSRVHSNETDQNGARGKFADERIDIPPRTDALQLKNPKKRKKKKKKNEERKDDGEDAEDSQEEESTKGSICSCKYTNIIDATKKINKVGKKADENDLSYLYKHIDKINKKLLSIEDYDLLISILYCNEYSRGSKYITMITVIINIFSVLLCNYNDEIFRFLCTNIYGVNINTTLNDHNISCHHSTHNQLYDISFAQLIYFMLIFLYKIFYQPCVDGIAIWMENGNELLAEKRRREAIRKGEANQEEQPQQCQEEEQINLDSNTHQEYSLRGHPNKADRSNPNLRGYRYEKKYVNNSYKDLYDNYIISYMQQESNEMNQLNNLLNRNNFIPNLIPYDIQIFKNIFLVFQKTLKHYLFCYMHCWNDVRTLLEYFLQSENLHIKIISIKIVIDIFSFINSYYEVNCSEYELPIYRQKDEYKNDNIFHKSASRGKEWDKRRGEYTLRPKEGRREEELPTCAEVCRKNRTNTGVSKTGFRHGVQRSPYGSVHRCVASAEEVRHISPHWSDSKGGEAPLVGDTSIGNNSIGNTSNRLMTPPKEARNRSGSKHAEYHMQERVPPEGSTNGTIDQHHSEATEMSKKKQFVQLVESDMVDLFRKYILVHIHNINKIQNDVTNRRSKLKHIFLNTIICISHLSYTGFKILTVEDIQRLTNLVSSCVHSIKCNIITALSKYIIKYIFTFNKKFIQNYEKRINLLHINSTNVYYNNILTREAGVFGEVLPGEAGTTSQSGISYASKNGSLKNDLQKDHLQGNIESKAHSAANLPNLPPPNSINGTSTNIFIHSNPTNMNYERENGRWKVCPVLIEEEEKIRKDYYPVNASPHHVNYPHEGWHDEKYFFENVVTVPSRSTMCNLEQVPHHSNSRRSSNRSTEIIARELRQVGPHSACTMLMDNLKDPVQYERSSDVTPYSRDTTISEKIGGLNEIAETERKAQTQKEQQPKQQGKENSVRCVSITHSTFKCSHEKSMMEEQRGRISNPEGCNAEDMAKKNQEKLTYTQKDKDEKDKERFPPISLAKMATNTRNVKKDKMSKLCGLIKRQNRREDPQWGGLKKHENLQMKMSRQMSGQMSSKMSSQISSQISSHMNRHMSNQVIQINIQCNNKQLLLAPTCEVAQSKKNTEHAIAQSRTRDTCAINSLHVYEKDQGDEPQSKDSLDRQRKDAYLLQKQRSERKLFELYYIYIYIIIHIIKFYNDSFVDLKYYTYNCICEIASSYVPFYFTQNNIKTFSYYSNYNSEENKDINKFINFINSIRLSSDVEELKLFRLRGESITSNGETVTGEFLQCNHHTDASAAEGFSHKGETCATSRSNNTTASSSCTSGRGALYEVYPCEVPPCKVPPCRGLSSDAGSIPTLANQPNRITAHNAQNLHDQFSNNIYLISYIEYIYILLLIIRENKNVEKDRAICCIIRYVGFICKNINFFLFNSISLLPSTFLLKYFVYLNNLIEKKGLLGRGLSRVGGRHSKGSSHGAANIGAVANEEEASKGKKHSVWGEELFAKMRTNLSSRNRRVRSKSSSRRSVRSISVRSRSSDVFVTVDTREHSPACAHQGERSHGQASSEVPTFDEKKSNSKMKPTQKFCSKMKSTQMCKLYHLFLNVYVKYEYNFEDSFFSCKGGAAKWEKSNGEKGISTRMASSNEDPSQRSEPCEGGRRKKKKKKGNASQEEEKPGRRQNTSVHDPQKQPIVEVHNEEHSTDELQKWEDAPQELLNPEQLFQGYSEKREEKVHADPIVIEIKDIFHSSRGKNNPINRSNNNVDAKIILYLLSIVKEHIKNKITWNVLYTFKLIYNNFSFFLAHNFSDLHSQILEHLISTLRYTNVYKIKILSSLALIHIPLYYNIDKIKLKELWDTLVTNISYLDLIFLSDKSNTNQLLCYYDKGLNYATISRKTEYKYKSTLRVNICELLYMCIYRSYVHANINADIEIHNRRVNCYEAFKNYTHIFNINNDVHIYNMTHIFNNHVIYYSFYNNVVPPKRSSAGAFSEEGGFPPNGKVRGVSIHSRELQTTSAVGLRQDISQLADRAEQVGSALCNQATLKNEAKEEKEKENKEENDEKDEKEGKEDKEEQFNHHDIFELQLFLNNHFDKYHFVYKSLLRTGKNPIFQILFQKLHYEIKLSLKRFLEKRRDTSLEPPRGVSN